MIEDHELLERYAAEGSEPAFAELTRRHVDLVYSAALRLVRGDVPAAQDVTQQVFSQVARNAKRLARHPALVGWLYATTRLMALRSNRTDQRRRTREQEAYTMNELLHDDVPPADWTQLGLVLEDAMHKLDDQDRHAVLLRFFQHKNLSEVGQVLNLSENAARMRIERALEKLRGKLARRGITTTAGALAALVSANAVQSAPAGFVAGLSAAALAGAAVPGGTVIAATKTLAMTTLQKTIVATAVAAAVGTGLYSAHHIARLNANVQTLEQQQAPLLAKIRQMEEDRAQTSNQLAALTQQNAQLQSRRSEAEVLRLRGEVGTLRQAAASLESQAAHPAGGIAKLMSDPAMKEYMLKAMNDKMKSLYADFIKEMNLTPEQTQQLLQVLTDAGAKNLDRLSAIAQGNAPAPDPGNSEPNSSQETVSQLRALLGDAGCVRLRDFSQELPGRATLSLLKDQTGPTPLTDEQSAQLIQVIKAEPANLTQGMLGAPDKAFLGTQVEIDQFLQQVSQSNQRILQQAGSFLNPGQLTALDTVLTKGIESRKLAAAAFFPKH